MKNIETKQFQHNSQAREKPDQKSSKNKLANKKYTKILFDYQQKQLASNKVCHTLSSSQRTHTHQHHQPQQPANFSEPCSNFWSSSPSPGQLLQPTRPCSRPQTRSPGPRRPNLLGPPSTPVHKPLHTGTESGWSSRIETRSRKPLTRTFILARLPGACPVSL